MRTATRMALIAALVIAVLPLTPARSDEAPHIPWTSLLPGFTSGFDPSSENDCTKGHENCVRSVIREMDRRFDRLGCDHDAAFALAYLRTTEEYHRFWHEGHFDEPAWLNHYDAVFARFYFDAIDDWQAGRTADVPQAWRIAFDASDRRKVTGYGSLFLGMNAHINRDLPFVLASIGMVSPDGTSRKTDHDRVNVFLNRLPARMLDELARRFDPTIDDLSIEQTVLDDVATFQAIPAWREMAWRHAEMLVEAPTAAARALIAQQIEGYAAGVANTIKIATSYGFLSPNGPNANARDAHCASNNHDRD